MEANKLYEAKLQKKLDRNVYGHEMYYQKLLSKDIPDYVCSIKGYKKLKLKDLSIEDKLEIVDDVMVKKDYHENICSRYGIGRESIKSLLKNIKKDPAYLTKLETKRQAKQR